MTKNQDCMRIYFQRTFLFLILRRQSISELGLMLMLILISGLIFARFKNKTFITTPPRLSFPSLCYFIEQEDESSNFTSITTGIYWVNKRSRLTKFCPARPLFYNLQIFFWWRRWWSQWLLLATAISSPRPPWARWGWEAQFDWVKRDSQKNEKM